MVLYVAIVLGALGCMIIIGALVRLWGCAGGTPEPRKRPTMPGGSIPPCNLVIPAPSKEEMEVFHTKEYVDFLSHITPNNMKEYQAEMEQCHIN